MSIFAELDAMGNPDARRGLAGLVFDYRMRWKRRRLLARSLRRRKELTRVVVHEDLIQDATILAFSTVRNEMSRLPFFLDHYRALGVEHFLIVDNASTDGTAQFLAEQSDVSLWTTNESYKASRFGVDWLGCLQFKFGQGRWCLTVDADEILVLPRANARLPELLNHLEETGRNSFGALMLDLYPKGPVNSAGHVPGSDPFDVLRYFDGDNYRAKRHPVFDNLWIQGGVRDRLFFANEPERAPTLNKTPLVKWDRSFTYVTSTHQMLPRRLNRSFEPGRPTGVLLHTKFLPNIGEKSAEELERRQHFENSALYEPYYQSLIADPDLWSENSLEYQGAEQLTSLGLMSAGDWFGTLPK